MARISLVLLLFAAILEAQTPNREPAPQTAAAAAQNQSSRNFD
jgi:hypothetical protein